MHILIATALDQPWSSALRARFTALAAQGRDRTMTIVDDPKEAQLIIFVDLHHMTNDRTLRALRRHPYVRSFPDKIVIYDETDRPRDLFPGMFVAMPRGRFDPSRHRAVSYYRLKTDTLCARTQNPDLLFSFHGRRLAGPREGVLQLAHARAEVEDTSEHDFFTADDVVIDGAQSRFRQALGRSKFVLCPRGYGTSSFRLYETLAAARVPVIVSDDWVGPSAVDWDRCAVRVREADVDSIPRRLEALEEAWPQMSEAAGLAYDSYFAEDVWLAHATRLCVDLPARRRVRDARRATARMLWQGFRRRCARVARGE